MTPSPLSGYAGDGRGSNEINTRENYCTLVLDFIFESWGREGNAPRPAGEGRGRLTKYEKNSEKTHRIKLENYERGGVAFWGTRLHLIMQFICDTGPLNYY